MIQCRRLNEAPIEDAHSAFCTGYSDYFLPLHVSLDQFSGLLLGAEGNDAALSWVAYDGKNPVGLILGGVRTMDGTRTMRCGTFCVSPEYRGTGTGRLLFERHRAMAEETCCRQLFLEVLTQNERAIRFYEAAGYRSGYTLKYYSLPGGFPRPACDCPLVIREMPFSSWEICRAALPDVHINWQNEAVCFASGMFGKPLVLGAEAEGRTAALVAMTPSGRVCFLWVDRAYRFRGVGRRLLHEASASLKPEKLSISLPNNAVLEGFVRKVGFQKDAVEQYEMFLPL